MKPILTGPYLFESNPRTLPDAKELIFHLRKVALAQHEVIKSRQALDALAEQKTKEVEDVSDSGRDQGVLILPATENIRQPSPESSLSL